MFFFSNWNYKFWIRKLASRLLDKYLWLYLHWCIWFCLSNFFVYIFLASYVTWLSYLIVPLCITFHMGERSCMRVRKYEKIRFRLTYNQSNYWIVTFFSYKWRSQFIMTIWCASSIGKRLILLAFFVHMFINVDEWFVYIIRSWYIGISLENNRSLGVILCHKNMR